MAHSSIGPERCYYVLAELQSLEGIYAPLKNTTRVKYLCFDVSKRYLALGVTSGDVFLFYRESLAFVGTVTNKEGSVVQVALGPDDGIVAIATSRGHVVVMEHNAERSLVQAQRLQLSYEHKGTTVTCLQWNGTGTRLFVGDSQGKVSVLNITLSKAKSLFQSPPNTLMRLDSKIVQLDFAQERLLASTLTRCYLGDTLRERFAQVGKKLRDGEFGCCFLSRGSLKSQEPATIYVARPGFRLWEADFRGSVLKTHQFKDSLSLPATQCVSYCQDYQFMEETTLPVDDASFGRLRCLFSNEKSPFILSWSTNLIYVMDPQRAEMVLWTDSFRDIRDIKLLQNRVYIQLANNQFHVCSFLTLENAVVSLFQCNHFVRCAQFLLENHCRISRDSFQQNIPTGFAFDLMDSLSNDASLSSKIARLVQEKYGTDLGKRPPRSESKTVRESAIPRLDVSVCKKELSSHHVRCHSSERARRASPSPKLSRRIPRRGSDPSCQAAPSARVNKTASSLPSNAGAPVDTPEVCYDNRNLSCAEKKESNVDLPLQLENLKATSFDDKHLNQNGVVPDSSVKNQIKPSCSDNGRRAVASSVLPIIPASPLESPLSPLDGVDPDVLASMCAEQDVGYESVYQYLNLGLYGAGVVPSAFSVRPSELMQLANVADLSKLKEMLSSKYLNSKEMLLKNLRGFESKIKYFGIESGTDVLSPGSPLATMEECPMVEPVKSTEKTVTPQDDFWLFLPPVGTNLTEATLRASDTMANPQVLFSMPKLSKVLDEWVTILHSSQAEVIALITSTDPCKLLAVSSCFPTALSHDAAGNSDQKPTNSTERNLPLEVVQSVFTSDPFHLSHEVKSKAKELAMLCFQMDLIGDTQVVERAVARVQHGGSLEKDRFEETPTEKNLLKCTSPSSVTSEDTSTRCDLSLSMRSSPSEKQYLHLSEVPTLDSCSDSIMFQSMSSSLGAASINLDFRPDDAVGKEFVQTSTDHGHGVLCVEASDAHGNSEGKRLSSQCLEDSPGLASPRREGEKIEMPKVAVPTNLTIDTGVSDGMGATVSNFSTTKEAEKPNSVQTRRSSLQSEPSPSVTSRSETASLSWIPMVQNKSRRQQGPFSNLADRKMACFIHHYFHLLDVDSVWEVLQATGDPCYQSWSTTVAGLCKRAKGNFLECGAEKGSDWIVTELEKVAQQPARILGYLAFLYWQDPECVADALLKKMSFLSARDILYFSRYINAHPSLFIEAMHRSLVAFPLPQMLSSVRKYLENDEVRWEWLNGFLASCDLQCLKCSCGAPRRWSHKATWPKADYLTAVLFNEQWVSVETMQLCQLYGFWPGYLFSLKHFGFRLEHLVTVIQLGDVELLSKSHQYGLLPESEEEWKLVFELVQKQQKGSSLGTTCLFCERSLDSGGEGEGSVVTVESLARRMLDTLGPNDTSDFLERLDLPKGSLSPHFFFCGTLITIIGQQQQALGHRILSRLESYLWSRRPVCIPPQIADVLEREKQGLASMEDLTDVQVQYMYGEEPDSHWGQTTTLLSSCAYCKQLLGTSSTAASVAVRHCGHAFHDCCLLGDFCVVCLETQGTG